MICLIYSQNKIDCLGYLDVGLVGAFLISFIIFWGVYSVFKILLKFLGF